MHGVQSENLQIKASDLPTTVLNLSMKGLQVIALGCTLASFSLQGILFPSQNFRDVWIYHTALDV